MRQILTLSAYVLIEAWRSYFLGVAVLLLAIGLGLTMFVGQLSLTETQALQSSLLAAFLRLAAVYLLSLFAVVSLIREFNDKTVYFLFSQAMPRTYYFFGKLGGLALLALLTAVLFSLALLPFAEWRAVSLWGGCLASELLIVATMSILSVFTFTHSLAALSAVWGFYLLARSITAIRQMAESGWYDIGLSDQVLRELIIALSVLLPDLERFTATSNLLYGGQVWETLSLVLTQTAIYTLLLSAMSLFDLYRKNL